MNIAPLNQKVTFQKYAPTVDEYGNHKNTWQDYYTCFATIGGENLASSRENAVAATIVEDFQMTATVRYCQKTAAVTATGYRIKLNGELYNITNIDHLNYRKKALKFICAKERR